MSPDGSSAVPCLITQPTAEKYRHRRRRRAPHGGRKSFVSLRIWRASLCLIAILQGGLLSGCVMVEVGVSNPVPGLTTVAVAPFFNLSAERSVDGRRFAMAYYTELQKTPGFQVVPVGVAEQAMHDHHLSMDDPADALKLAEILKVDAVVVGAVTEYYPYYPPRVGMQVSWYSPRPWVFFPGIPVDDYALYPATPKRKRGCRPIYTDYPMIAEDCEPASSSSGDKGSSGTSPTPVSPRAATPAPPTPSPTTNGTWLPWKLPTLPKLPFMPGSEPPAAAPERAAPVEEEVVPPAPLPAENNSSANRSSGSGGAIRRTIFRGQSPADVRARQRAYAAKLRDELPGLIDFPTGYSIPLAAFEDQELVDDEDLDEVDAEPTPPRIRSRGPGLIRPKAMPRLAPPLAQREVIEDDIPNSPRDEGADRVEDPRPEMERTSPRGKWSTEHSPPLIDSLPEAPVPHDEPRRPDPSRRLPLRPAPPPGPDLPSRDGTSSGGAGDVDQLVPPSPSAVPPGDDPMQSPWSRPPAGQRRSSRPPLRSGLPEEDLGLESEIDVPRQRDPRMLPGPSGIPRGPMMPPLIGPPLPGDGRSSPSSTWNNPGPSNAGGPAMSRNGSGEWSPSGTMLSPGGNDQAFDPRQPLMSYTRMFDATDPRLTARLRDYVDLSGDLRSGGWEAYLHRSEDFIRFTQHVMIVEMLQLHGGETHRRIVVKHRKAK